LLKEKGVCFKDCSKSANFDVAGSSDIAQINKETDGKIEFPASKVAVADDLD